jgi:hypothetical protein
MFSSFVKVVIILSLLLSVHIVVFFFSVCFFLFHIFPSRNCHSLLRGSLSYLCCLGEYFVFEYSTRLFLAFPAFIFRPWILKKGFVSWIRLRKFYKLVSNMWCSCCMRLMRVIKQLVENSCMTRA